MADRRRPSSEPKPGSLPSVVARHLAGFLIGAAGALVLSRIAPGAEQPLVWLIGGLLVGLACSLLGGGWLGLLFVVGGLWIGVWLDPNRPPGPAADTLDVLGSIGPAYLAVVSGASVAYALALLALRRIRGSGLIQRGGST